MIVGCNNLYFYNQQFNKQIKGIVNKKHMLLTIYY